MPDPRPNQTQVDQAIEWLVRLRFSQPTEQTEQQFQRWLQQHPHNPLAWQRVE
ncbi:MAG TPA: iron dicitrate transport regulator FecR, partial [Pseudomonas sp.]|nr:iron dicitrate transport regulator FecR [Pseudomonas sp.]